MIPWSDLEFQAVNRFIRQQIRQYGHRMDEEECVGESWRALLEASHSYHLVEGCCDFRSYAAHEIHAALDRLRRHRNKRIQLESPLSLDMRFEDSEETVGERYFRGKTGDCSNSVALRDYMERQGEEKCRILWQLWQQKDDREIMEDSCIPPEDYYRILGELQEAFREWLAI